MYKINLFLKIIITIFVAIVVVITNNYSFLWLLLLFVSTINFLIKNNLHLFFDLLMVFLLILSKYFWGMVLVFRILFLFSLIFSFFRLLTLKEKKYIKNMYFPESYKKKKNKFHKMIFNSVMEKNKLEKDRYYDDEVPIDDKIERDLNRLFLQSRIRFYGCKNVTINKWTSIDTIILIVSVILFLFFLLVR